MKNWNLQNRTVLLRVDFNVPIKEGQITDATRITKALPTLQYLLKQGAKLIVMSHLGRPLKQLTPEGQIDLKKFSLKPIAEKLAELLQLPVLFASDCGGPDTLEKIKEVQAGGVLLLENTRFRKEEEKGDPDYAKQLASLGEYYINDAFGAAHREHASTATIARFFDKEHKSFGLLMEAEVENGKKVLQHPQKPFTAIIGGAKVSDKIELISNLIGLCDEILIGGGMAYTFLKAQGFGVGKSLCEEDKLDLALELLEKARAQNVGLHLPLDSVIAQEFGESGEIKCTEDPNVEDGWMGLDIGPKSIEAYRAVILKSKTIIWNGPMGVFEMASFSSGTKAIAMAVAQATAAGGYSLIGGGDSVAAINTYQLEDQVSFVSTGGGAMLEMLEGKKLPGISAILE